SEAELRPSVGVSLNLPLNLGRLAAREHEARAALSKAESERLAVRDRIEQRIEEASASLVLYLHDVEIMRGAVVPASERSLKAVRAAYEANRSDFLTLLNSTRDLLRARLELYEAQVMAHEAEAEVSMPAMGAMPRMESRGKVKEVKPGVYRAEYGLAMNGEWDVNVRVRPKNGAKVEAAYRLSTSTPGLAFASGTPAVGRDQPVGGMSGMAGMSGMSGMPATGSAQEPAGPGAGMESATG